MKRTVFVMFAVALLASCNRCKEECTDSTNPDCPNYVAPDNACVGKESVSADFKIFQAIYLNEGYEESSSGVHANKDIRVSANNRTAISYKWILGIDTLYTPDYNFYFPSLWVGQSAPLTLIVADTIDHVCNPEDDGVDTITKYINVHHRCEVAWRGTWKVAYDDAPLDSFNLFLDLTPGPVQGDLCNLLELSGISLFTNDTCTHYSPYYTYNYIEGGLSTPCYTDAIYLRVENDLNHVSGLVNRVESISPFIRNAHFLHGRRIQ
jgi:hypothetical protein